MQPTKNMIIRTLLLAVPACAGLFFSPLQAQVFAPIPALSFVKPFAGADPLPQTITIASVGTGFNFGTTVSTASGGNWLSVSPPSCCYSTPRALTVTVTTGAAMAVAPYSGQIVVTSSSGTVTMTIPVTLTVVSTSTSFLDNLQGQMSFSLKTGGTAITSQDIQVRNGGTGSLNWTLSKTTSDGGNWLTVSGTSGTAPTLITVGVTVANLPGGGVTPGTFIGQLVFQTTGSTITVPVAVVVGDNILTQVNGINFTKVFGGPNPLPQTLTFASTGNTFNVGFVPTNATGGTWLATSFDGCCYAVPQSISASVNASPTLPVGTYTGQIVITTSTGSQAITVPVTLTVAAVGGTYLDNLAGQVSFSLKTGGATITSQDIQIRNGGAGTLNWTLKTSTSDAGQWLTVSTNSGTAPSLVTVGVIVANLPNSGLVAGTFVGELVFQSAGSSISVPVTVVVGANILTEVNGINFTKVFGGADPLPQTLTFASTGTTFNVAFSATTSTGGNWLSTSLSGCCYAIPQSIAAVVAASPTLPVGIYTGQIVVTTSTGNDAITVPVTLTVAAANTPFFDNVPGQMSFAFKTGSTNSPPPQSIQIRNAGAGSLDWSLGVSTSDGGNWLSSSALSGIAPSTVSVSLLKQNLPGQGLIAGTFVGSLVFRSSSGSSVTVSVTAVVGDNILAQVNGISFTKPFAGANPLPQTLTFTSLGTNVNVSISTTTANGGNWLTTQLNGCCYGTPRVIVATVNASPTLPAGTYTGQIVLTTNTGSEAITVPVTLTVANSGAFFDNVPGQVSFSFTPGAGNPANQTVQIRNAGTGTLNWTVTPSTSDGGNWLTVSPPNGTASSNVTVGVDNNSLPNQGLVAGNFIGELVFSAPGSSVTLPVSVVAGNNTFLQLAPLSFSKNFGGTSPLPQTLNVTSAGANFTFEIDASTGTGGTWLSASPSACCYATPKSVTATVTSPANMSAGIFTGQVVFITNTGSMAMTVPSILTVSEVTPGAPTLTAPANGATGVSVTPSLTWSAVPGATSYDVYFGASSTPPFVANVLTTSYSPSSLSMGTAYFWRVVAKNGAGSTTSSTFSFTTVFATPPTLTAGPSILNFHYKGNLITASQKVTVTFANGSLAWTASSNQGTITVSPASGTGNGSFNVTAAPGASGVVTVTAAGATGSPQQIQVNVASTAGGLPFGSFDTPASGTTGIAGAIAVTGWALDNVEVATVGVWREQVGSEPVAGNGLVFVGNAVLVDGARPDIVTAYPAAPRNTRAGWGYLLLTNFLPNTSGSGPIGNGTYKLHAIITNTAGQTFDLGAHSITVDNAHASRPFGAIDTPDQGATISGSQFINFGWGLTQNPFCISTDGSTIFVAVDGVTLGHPTYNQNRVDIATTFPGLCNSTGGVGYFFLDTTTLANGVHTIYWLVYDNQGRGDGVGSRFFNVLNATSSAAPEEPLEPATNGVLLRTHYDLLREPQLLVPERSGLYVVDLEELGRMELHAGVTSGYLMVGGRRMPLPAGSTLRAGVFYWQLAAGFLGKYELVLVRPDGGEVRVQVRVSPARFGPAVQ